MILNKKEYKFYLEADKIALDIDTRTGLRRRFRNYFNEDLWRFEKLLRKTEYFQNCSTSFLGKAYFFYLRLQLQRRQMKLGSLQIGPNCFGPGLSIAHQGNILVNSGARIGANCRIHPGVVIGTEAGYPHKAPTIGDNVFIGPGAKIFGEITIANGIAIGANSVVNKSFLETNITIAGVPAKKVSNKGSKGLLVDATELLTSKSK